MINNITNTMIQTNSQEMAITNHAPHKGEEKPTMETKNTAGQTAQLQVESCKPYEKTRGRDKFLVFVDMNRPFDNGDVIGDFAWRRTHETPFTSKEVLAAVKETLRKEGVNDEDVVSIKYSRYAGCSMCPCSPGFVITTKLEKNHMKMGIWMKQVPVEKQPQWQEVNETFNVKVNTTAEYVELAKMVGDDVKTLTLTSEEIEGLWEAYYKAHQKRKEAK